jgi:hypothetical protein
MSELIGNFSTSVVLSSVISHYEDVPSNVRVLKPKIVEQSRRLIHMARRKYKKMQMKSIDPVEHTMKTTSIHAFSRLKHGLIKGI